MANGRAAHRGWVARWVLLACTVFGLAAMHTLGHGGVHMDTRPGHGVHAADVAAAMTTVAGMPTDAAGCAGCAHLLPAGPGQGGMSVWSVCLAVLGGLAAVVLLAALLLTWSRRRGSPAAPARVCPFVPRGPPRPAGLRLVMVSVLRI